MNTQEIKSFFHNPADYKPISSRPLNLSKKIQYFIPAVLSFGATTAAIYWGNRAAPAKSQDLSDRQISVFSIADFLPTFRETCLFGIFVTLGLATRFYAQASSNSHSQKNQTTQPSTLVGASNRGNDCFLISAVASLTNDEIYELISRPQDANEEPLTSLLIDYQISMNNPSRRSFKSIYRLREILNIGKGNNHQYDASEPFQAFLSRLPDPTGETQRITQRTYVDPAPPHEVIDVGTEIIPFPIVHIEIPVMTQTFIPDLLRADAVEEIDFNRVCPKGTKSSVEPTRRTDRLGQLRNAVVKTTTQKWIAPPRKLNILLKRYKFDLNGSVAKISTPISNPNSFVLPPECLQNHPEGEVHYFLTEFIEHIGDSPTNGHYIAYRKRNGEWYRCDDHVISLVSEELALDKAKTAYVLRYTKQGGLMDFSSGDSTETIGSSVNAMKPIMAKPGP